MTTYYLIRHASTDFLGHTIVGRRSSVHLNEKGRREAETLAAGLAREPVQHIFSSPMERCLETVEPLARKLKLEIQISDALNELDYGEWTGRTFAELNESESWKQWNRFRSFARIPGGETMIEASARMVSFAESMRHDLADQHIALVSHGDPLRGLLLHFLGMPLDLIHRIELSPASLSVLSVSGCHAQVRNLNAQFAAEQVQL
jgi:broad specificity phosphatase PhoE